VGDGPVRARVLAGLHALFDEHGPVAPIVEGAGDLGRSAASRVDGRLGQVAVAHATGSVQGRAGLVVDVGAELHQVGRAGADPAADRPAQAVVEGLVNRTGGTLNTGGPAALVVGHQGAVIIDRGGPGVQ